VDWYGEAFARAIGSRIVPFRRRRASVAPFPGAIPHLRIFLFNTGKFSDRGDAAYSLPRGANRSPATIEQP